MTAAERLVDEAARLVGCRFQLHGRNPEVGLDCVGLVAVALERAGMAADFPLDYSLKTKGDARIPEFAARAGLVPADGATISGDILLLQVGPCQLHFAICVDSGAAIHAHAGLRRIVRSPAQPDGTIISRWRFPNQ